MVYPMLLLLVSVLELELRVGANSRKELSLWLLPASDEHAKGSCLINLDLNGRSLS